ncbi:hypothetical protein K435DRAFT_794779 [Dendrothele bispora CBS 962.96]|uniref:Uncharacterized protein n=1 Tax=Dendrothele bispora (strain CBS 962.96) TaxID=1314807 RepID=A0A4S8MAX8_DENBC|nr:hypothetical protein K435DRAFT_794779 [Dendrothele bispora CBS 962.96]
MCYIKAQQQINVLPNLDDGDEICKATCYYWAMAVSKQPVLLYGMKVHIQLSAEVELYIKEAQDTTASYLPRRAMTHVPFTNSSFDPSSSPLQEYDIESQSAGLHVIIGLAREDNGHSLGYVSFNSTTPDVVEGLWTEPKLSFARGLRRGFIDVQDSLASHKAQMLQIVIPPK